jgi:perosamine synthetase
MEQNNAEQKKPEVQSKIFVAKPVMDKEMLDAALNALQNEKLVGGESVKKFEAAFAKYIGTDFAVTTNSGTGALQLSMMAMGISSREHEVITTPASFIASANAIIHAGGTPRFSEIEKATNGLNPDKLASAITGRTKAIIPVHLYGMPVRMDEINEIAQKKGIPVLEDAAQAHGSIYKGKKCGSLGTIGAFSFYSTKNMTVGGNGGMVTTNDEKLAKIVKKYTDSGRMTVYEHDLVGFTYDISTVSAAIGLVQLKNLDKWNERRREIAAFYRHKLSSIGAERFDMPVQEIPSENTFGNYHLFAVRCPERDKLKAFLAERSIYCGNNYPIPIHLQPIYQKLYPENKPGSFPVAEELSRNVICLPMFAELSNSDAARVTDAVLEFFGR